MNITYPYKIITDGDMSASINSTVVDLTYRLGASIQAVWTGTPTGTLKLQASNDQTNWDDVANSSQSLSGSAGSYSWNDSAVYYPYLRLVYTFSSGSGTLNATAAAKGNR